MKNGPFRNINDMLLSSMCSQMQIKIRISCNCFPWYEIIHRRADEIPRLLILTFKSGPLFNSRQWGGFFSWISNIFKRCISHQHLLLYSCSVHDEQQITIQVSKCFPRSLDRTNCKRLLKMWRKDLVYICNRKWVCAKHLKISTFRGLYVSNDAEYFNWLRLAVFVGLLWILMTRSNSDNTAPEKFSTMWEHNTRSIGHAKYNRAARGGHIHDWPNKTYLYVKVELFFCYRYMKMLLWYYSSWINASTQSKQNWKMESSKCFPAQSVKLWPKIDLFVLIHNKNNVHPFIICNFILVGFEEHIPRTLGVRWKYTLDDPAFNWEVGSPTSEWRQLHVSYKVEKKHQRMKFVRRKLTS